MPEYFDAIVFEDEKHCVITLPGVSSAHLCIAIKSIKKFILLPKSCDKMHVNNCFPM